MSRVAATVPHGPYGADPVGLTSIDDVYDESAATYRTSRRLWLAIAGFGAELRVRRALRRTLRSDSEVLDAGGGTGAMTRIMTAIEPAAPVTLLDRSAGMLAEARPAGAARVRGDLTALPFPAESFDVVVAAWVLETLPEQRAAICEMLRVLRPQGHLLMEFSAQPRSRWAAILWRPVDRVLAESFGGHFLELGEVPFHDCRRSSRHGSWIAPTATIFLDRCCLAAIAEGRSGQGSAVAPCGAGCSAT